MHQYAAVTQTSLEEISTYDPRSMEPLLQLHLTFNIHVTTSLTNLLYLFISRLHTQLHQQYQQLPEAPSPTPIGEINCKHGFYILETEEERQIK